MQYLFYYFQINTNNWIIFIIISMDKFIQLYLQCLKCAQLQLYIIIYVYILYYIQYTQIGPRVHEVSIIWLKYLCTLCNAPCYSDGADGNTWLLISECMYIGMRIHWSVVVMGWGSWNLNRLRLATRIWKIYISMYTISMRITATRER